MKKRMELMELPADATARSDELLPAYKAACNHMADYLEGKVGGSDKTKIAAVVINGFGRIIGSETNKIALRIQAQRQIQGSDIEIDDGGKVKLLKG